MTNFCDDNEAASQTPPPPRCAWSPSPTIVGADERRVLAARSRPSFAKPLQKAVIARSEATKQSSIEPRKPVSAAELTELPTGLLHGACHRAGHFGPDPLARNDERKRKRNADKRGHNLRTIGCGAAQRGSTPVGVPPRLSPEGVLVPRLSFRPCFLGRSRSAGSYKPAPTGGRKTLRSLSGRYPPHLSQSREAPPVPVIMPGD